MLIYKRKEVILLKKYRTIAISMPVNVVDDVDKTAKAMNISRSALLTAFVSVVLNWKEKGEISDAICRGKERESKS